MRIVCKDLKYTYEPKAKNKTYALKGVDLTIEEGDFFGIVGKTGSGKSTFVQHLDAIVRVQKNSGELTVGEFDLAETKKKDFRDLRKKVGMVFQYPEYQLFAETVEADVEFGLKNYFPEMDEVNRKNAVRYALEAVGLDYLKIKNKSPFDLSGGQKRRVAIAGVIVTKPEILVLDEPASGLDPEGKKELFGLLHELHKNFAKTVIVVSHDMNVITENCNRAAIFSDGKIVKSGTPKEVFSDEAEIESYGLNLPTTVYLTNRLKEAGVEIDSDLTVKDFTETLYRTIKETGR